MIIWRGLGYLVVVIALGVSIFTQIITNRLFSNTVYYQTHQLPKLLAGFIAGGTIWFLGRYLNRRPGEEMIEKKTGKEVILKKKNDLFFIPMKWWGPIVIILSLVFSLNKK